MNDLKGRVVYIDNHLIAVNKLAGEIVQEDKSGDVPLFEKVKEYVRIEFNKPGEAFLGVIHRIDRPVSGVVLFARTSKGLQRMNELFKSRQIKKTYLAIVEKSPPEQEETITRLLKKNQNQNKSYIVNKKSKEANESILSYCLLSASDRYYLLSVNPVSGRHHQIRAMLADIGCTIKGDLKYGAKRSNPDGSICLHAFQLEFTHPVHQNLIKIQAKPPNDNLWDYFYSEVVA
ncbi:MAG TPA: RNA pseudouridine synthase [Bacteroidia bacterium]|nr:RNA pseudouridine synthase [Bacteroidia bacterium]HNT80992.1 RNA pseudouridine synthase [Bacteroidia bacterium]